MEWLKQEWPRLVMAGLIETAIGLIALGVISVTVHNSDIRDIGIVSIWVAVILGGAAFLIVRITTSDLVRPEDVPRIIKEKLETGPSIPLEPSPAAPSLSPTATDSMAAFDPYTIITELGGVDLSGLEEPESFMTITLNVRNVSGYPVTITGVKGRIRCAGAECNSPATVEREPRQLTNSSNLVPCTIRQPLSSGMMNTVALAGGLLRISLSDLEWVGSVALPQGTESLESCYIHEDFAVRGPYQQKHYASTLFRPTTTFLSSELYDSDGTPKQNG